MFLGLDIGRQYVKMVAMNKTKDGYKLIDAGQRLVPDPNQAFDPDKIDTHHWVMAIKELLRQQGLNPKKIKILATGISGASASVKQITTMDMPTEELASAMTFEARKHIPMDGTDAVIDYMKMSNPSRFGKVLFLGKVTDLLRETVNGFTKGTLRLKSLSNENELLVEFQNEFLYAKSNDKVLAMVPDLICALDSESGEPITTDGLRYGQRIKIVSISVPPVMRTKKALDLFGPKAFGLNFDYVPLEDL